MRVLPIILAAIVSTVSLSGVVYAEPKAAEPLAVEFDGQHYTLNFEDQAALPDGSMGNALAEFTLKGETVENWSKLFAFYAYPQMGTDPAAAVEAVGKVVKETNPDANYAIDVSNEKEAIIDFLTWAEGSEVMEFNVFRYTPADDGPGLIAMQYAQHINIDDMDVEAMRALRERAVREMAAMDMDAAQDYFAAKREQMSAKAEDGDAPSFAERDQQ
ncbi:hypothetical protein [Hyphomicrobium sp. D-2]|uniref:hypothetical protein n=1 Tax=Hyphomicrobium sp. D-2 TaxID=3041621 RepID=UPI00245676F2|nr:hypothetical protein [Hyphomicrobium sp. D-2]MDH4983843.1 hypothetical protein [Hyphomicrobium sp. D-2]